MLSGIEETGNKYEKCCQKYQINSSKRVTKKTHFLLIGRKAFFPHFLHLTLPLIIFWGSALIFDWQFLQTNTFLKSLLVASGIFAIFYIHNFLFIIFCPSTFQYSTLEFVSISAFNSSGISISTVSKLSRSITLAFSPTERT